MSLAKAVAYVGGLQQQVMPGDVVAYGETYPVTIAGNNQAIPAIAVIQNFLVRTPSANGTDVWDTSSNIIAAIIAQNGGQGVQPGTSWRTRVVNLAAFTIGVSSAGGGAVTNGNINASSVKDFLLQIVNGNPATTQFLTTTNGSAVLGGLTPAQAALISPGMQVSSVSANFQGGTVIGVNSAAGTVTMNGNANATNSTPISFTFIPIVNIIGIGQGLL